MRLEYVVLLLFFIGCLSLSGRLHIRALGINHPKEKSKNRIQEAFWTIQRILPDRQNFHPVGAEGFYTVRIRISLERGQYRHMWEIVYDNVVPFDRIQSFMTRLGVMTQGRVRDNFK